MAKKFSSDDERRAYWRAWYQNNKHRSDYKAKNRATSTRIRKERNLWWNEYRQTLKCFNCSESDYRCLDFHHLDPNQKDKEVTTMVHRCFSKEKILAEAAKCICLCSNCHRKLHWDEKHNPKIKT